MKSKSAGGKAHSPIKGFVFDAPFTPAATAALVSEESLSLFEELEDDVCWLAFLGLAVCVWLMASSVRAESVASAGFLTGVGVFVVLSGVVFGGAKTCSRIASLSM